MTPATIQEKANDLLTAVKNRQIRPRKTRRQKHRVINVSYRWRLVNKGRKWVLMSHEEYNNSIKRN